MDRTAPPPPAPLESNGRSKWSTLVDVRRRLAHTLRLRLLNSDSSPVSCQSNSYKSIDDDHDEVPVTVRSQRSKRDKEPACWPARDMGAARGEREARAGALAKTLMLSLTRRPPPHESGRASAAVAKVDREGPTSDDIGSSSSSSSSNLQSANTKTNRNKRQKKTQDDERAPDSDVDGGYAWIVLAVIFVINASTFGTARAYGLIFDKLARADDKTRTDAAMPFTIMGAVENMAGPLSGYLLAHTRQSWRLTVCLGSCLVAAAHLCAAALADSQLGQLLAMGLACGLGLSFVSISFFQLNNAYFARYRSTAFGLGMTGAAFGTLYISPLCQYFLDNYGTSMCYLMLGLILLPNVPLSLLLRPKLSLTPTPTSTPTSTPTLTATTTPTATHCHNQCKRGWCQSRQLVEHITAEEELRRKPALCNDTCGPGCRGAYVDSISHRLERAQEAEGVASVWTSVRRVFANPMFHLIWPTQLLFCWLNFVFGMIIVDFGRDRGLDARQLAHLVPSWAFGQLVGRLCLSSLVDLRYLTYKTFTVICFFAITATTFLLNQLRTLGTGACVDFELDLAPTSVGVVSNQMHLVMLSLVFTLSMFIALLYILLNGLVVSYVEPPLQPLSIGISSFTGSFFLLPRANIIGYYRDTTGNYDAMLTMFTYVSLLAALVWLLVPALADWLAACGRKLDHGHTTGSCAAAATHSALVQPALWLRRAWQVCARDRHRKLAHSRAMENVRVYSQWRLENGLCQPKIDAAPGGQRSRDQFHRHTYHTHERQTYHQHHHNNHHYHYNHHHRHHHPHHHHHHHHQRQHYHHHDHHPKHAASFHYRVDLNPNVYAYNS